MKLDHYPFKGWDYMELAEAWGVYMPDDDSLYIEDPALPLKYFIVSVMRGYNGVNDTRPMKKLANDCRIYLKKLGDPETSHTYCGPMWLGMANIKDNWTLLNHVMVNIGYMWD